MFRRSREVRIHFVGIGGVGMSGIAEVLLTLGYRVSGSDLRETDATRRLAGLGGRIAVGHAAHNVAEADVVVVSSAVRADNPEVAEARRRDVPVIPRAEMLGELMRVKDGVAVAGSHGKTTTTSMVASVLALAGLDPTVIIGGKAQALGSGARLGHGDVLVAEADESDGSFRHLFPHVAVVTNVDREHLDHYGSLDALRAAFVEFVNKVPFYGVAIICADDPAAASLCPDLYKRHVTYGMRAGGADYCGVVVDAGPDGTRFAVSVRGTPVGEATVRIPGVHYAQNAVAAYCVADFFGVSFADYRQAMEAFAGVDRRFSVLGEAGGVLVVDDYGHHPTEIAATVAAARLYRRRVVVAFQPHRYTRTRDLLGEFAPALRGADVVVLTDIYGAGEAPIPGADAEALLATFAGRAGVHHVPRAGLVGATRALLRPGDLLLVLGAGDITYAAPEIVEALGALPS